ncbi:hypothetical protein [Amaricoccus solimangrovi]|uniref:Uncharacterized protein n=1 Tax=Amaricoccus solimangrovi TaxID=2589815 RepID=A0A501WZC8_9RHOB|nr:hypothetical protein [Amaricoccus solimangrovi]TPE53087.1 hypothetical protein FJM51_03425 [Amaricoccus solimangrovi]
MNWQDLGEELRGIGLSAVGGALVGGAPGAVLATGQEIAKRIGAAEASPEVIRDALEADPEALAQMRALEVEMAKVDERREARAADSAEELARIATADVQDARATRGVDDWMRAALAPLVLAITVALSVYIFKVTPEGKEPSSTAMYILGQFGGFSAAVIYFYFGSSLGSARRAEEISRMKGAGK